MAVIGINDIYKSPWKNPDHYLLDNPSFNERKVTAYVNFKN